MISTVRLLPLCLISGLILLPSCGGKKTSTHKQFVDSLLTPENMSPKDFKKRNTLFIECLDLIDALNNKYQYEARLLKSVDRSEGLNREQKEEKLTKEIKKLIQLKRNFNSYTTEPLNEPWTFMRYKNTLEQDMATVKRNLQALDIYGDAVTKTIMRKLEIALENLDRIFEAIYLDTDVIRDQQITILSNRIKALEQENQELQQRLQRADRMTVVVNNERPKMPQYRA